MQEDITRKVLEFNEKKLVANVMPKSVFHRIVEEKIKSIKTSTQEMAIICLSGHSFKIKQPDKIITLQDGNKKIRVWWKKNIKTKESAKLIAEILESFPNVSVLVSAIAKKALDNVDPTAQYKSRILTCPPKKKQRKKVKLTNKLH